MRAGRAAIGVAAAIGGLAIGGPSALGASTAPAGGHVDVFVQSEGAGAGKILISGAIGDSGTTESIDKSGRSDPVNGDYVKVTLSQGMFEVNNTALVKALHGASPNINKTTCSAGFSITVSDSLLDGSGLYKGIGGALKVTEFVGFVSPRYASGKNKGQCNLSTQPASQLGVIVATGSVHFS
jgi:hypothetical protein